MDDIRVYKTFYLFNYRNNISGTTETISVIDPISISASTYNFDYTQLSNPIENNLIVYSDEPGMYYVKLLYHLYSDKVDYVVKWDVNYTNNSPVKELFTKFRYKNIVAGIGQQISYTIENDVYEIIIS